MMPLWKAQICKVGKGRESPNVNPHLPEPLGRWEWSLNPFRMIVKYFNNRIESMCGPGV